MERVDLAEALAGYGEREAAPGRAPARAGDTVYLGDFLVNQRIIGPSGPAPSWPLVASAPAGASPPALQFDGDGVYFTHPETGERVDFEPACQGCGATRRSLTQRSSDQRGWLCDDCRRSDGD